MFQNLKQLYALAVCFVCAIVLIVSTGVGFNSALSYVVPHYMNYSYMANYESNEKYLEFYEYNDKRLAELKKLSAEQLKTAREAKRDDFLREKRRGAVHTLVQIVPWVVTALVFFFIHWRLYRRFSEED